MRGVTVAQLFIYILAILVFSLTIWYGFRAIGGLLEQQEQISFIEFKTSIESEIESITPQFGSVEAFNERNNFPTYGFDQICFIDLNVANLVNQGTLRPGICESSSADFNFAACEAWKTQADGNFFQNVFTTPDSPSILVETDFTVDGNADGREDTVSNCNSGDCFYLCLNKIQNRFDFRLTSKGRHTVISVNSVQ